MENNILVVAMNRAQRTRKTEDWEYAMNLAFAGRDTSNKKQRKLANWAVRICLNGWKNAK